jgi:hypothetical protein
LEERQSNYIRRLRVLVPDANASMLPLAGEALTYSKEALSSLIVAALIMVPQVIVAIMAPWAGRRANT